MPSRRSLSIICSVLILSVLFTGANPTIAGFATPSGISSPRDYVRFKAEQQTTAPLVTDTAHPLLSDVRIRQAIAYCTDHLALIVSVYPFLDSAQKQALVTDTFIPQTSWLYSAPPITATYPFSPTAGQDLLTQAGWLLQSGDYRTNADGYQLAIKLTTTNSGFRETYAAALETQLRDNCGIHLVREHIPASVWFGDETGLFRREFELGAVAWVSTPDPQGRSRYACDSIPTSDNGWVGQNLMGWCNPIASEAIVRATESVSRQERIDNYATVQDEYARDMISLPLFHRVDLWATHPGMTGFVPDPIELFTWNAYSWTVPATDTIVIASTQEPASLFPLVEGSFIAQAAASLIYGRPLTGLNYDHQAQLYQSLPTLENGGATSSTVNVGSGTVVVDITDNVVTLVPGVQVRNAAGQAVVYGGGTVSMTQMTVTGSFLNGMVWSNGLPLVQGDLELWDEINCDPASGGSSYYCERTAGRQYINDTTVEYTLVPGYLDPLYYAHFLPGAYPSERVLADSRKLKDVPAVEWSTLLEIQRNPIGLGPYRLTDWQFGQSMTFTANPYFVLGAPATEHIRVEFFTDSNSAVDALLSGSVHILTSQTGADGASLAVADDLGQVDLYAVAHPTVETLDMNLDLFTQVVVKDLSPAGGVLSTSVGIQLAAPAGALTETTTFTFNHLPNPSQPLTASQSLLGFSLTAVDDLGQPITEFQQPLTLTIDYDEAEVTALGLTEENLNVAYWDGASWVALLPCAGCSIDTINNQISVVLTHLTEFAVTSSAKVHLPFIRR